MENTLIIGLAIIGVLGVALVVLGAYCHKLQLKLYMRDRELAMTRQQYEDLRAEREEFTNMAAGRMIERMQGLSSELLAQHKLASGTDRQHYFQEMQKFTQDLHTRLNETLTKVNELSGVATRSAESFDVLHKAIYEPRIVGFAAETALENCLRSFHLRENIDFKLQISIDKAQGGRIRPDAMVYLPDDICLVIDSKSSKFLFGPEIPEENYAYDSPQNLSKAIRNHVRTLAQKDYVHWVVEDYRKHNDDANVTPTCLMVMWLPSDAAMDNVIKADKAIVEFAKQKNVLICGPSGLWAIVAMAEYRIIAARHSRNQEAIRQEIETLLKAITRLDGNMDDLRKGLTRAFKGLAAFDSYFQNSFVTSASKLIKLGVQPPPNWKGKRALASSQEGDVGQEPKENQNIDQNAMHPNAVALTKLSLVDE
ncbi:MAG: DNA recombination protein RmuC [Pseudomonadota bacterium]